MSRINLVDPKSATGTSAELLGGIHAAFGATPNMFKAVANSPAALASMWGSFGALGTGRLGAKLGEQIAVAVADRNDCHYCLAAHTALGRKAGASAQEMAEAQRGQSDDPRTAAALSFARKLVDARGQIADADITALRVVGYDDQDIVEVIAHVALNLFTNYINVALAVPVDFPGVKLVREAA
ncbi:peroxidase-related enzyme [Ensifer sp.]|uniref:carboxymuconolactone decarboxylase family protein n=1 Tax=Ensifer sp. TaxID=1872086 RepID=UPI0028A27069|nr:peroxidase-related enzyme [Ensifer sp.]